MTKADILSLMGQHIREVMPELQTHHFTEQDRLSDLGANSIDRADIIMMTLESLALAVPLVEFARAKNLGELVEMLYEKCQAA